MKFTLATFVTLVAAGAAAPSPQAEGPSISQEGKNKLDQYSHQCGDIKNINCCITVKDTEKKNQLLGIPGWLGATLNSQSDDNDDICRSATNGDTGVFDYLPALLGLSASEQGIYSPGSVSY